MDKLKRAGEGYWFWLGLSLLWIFTSNLHVIAQVHSEQQQFLQLWNLLLIFWIVNSAVISGFILSEYFKLENSVEEVSID
jgi:hypothetical protein